MPVNNVHDYQQIICAFVFFLKTNYQIKWKRNFIIIWCIKKILVFHIFSNSFLLILPMCFITIELRRSYAVTAIALWPVSAKNCDAVTHNYDKKIVVTRSYDRKISTMRKYVIVFRNSRFQLKCKYSATASFYFVSFTTVDKQSS